MLKFFDGHVIAKAKEKKKIELIPKWSNRQFVVMVDEDDEEEAKRKGFDLIVSRR